MIRFRSGWLFKFSSSSQPVRAKCQTQEYSSVYWLCTHSLCFGGLPKSLIMCLLSSGTEAIKDKDMTLSTFAHPLLCSLAPSVSAHLFIFHSLSQPSFKPNSQSGCPLLIDLRERVQREIIAYPWEKSTRELSHLKVCLSIQKPLWLCNQSL